MGAPRLKMLDLKANFRKVCTEKQSGTGTSARVHATYVRVCRRAGALPSPVLLLVRSAVVLVHTFNAPWKSLYNVSSFRAATPAANTGRTGRSRQSHLVYWLVPARHVCLAIRLANVEPTHIR